MSQLKTNDQVLTDIKGKIARETKLIQGFQALKRNTQNAEVIQRCNNQIRETQSNIDYLNETLNKLTLQMHPGLAPESPQKRPQEGSKPVYSRFDLIKYDCPSLGHKIQYMLQQLQFKLQVENQYREANEKILHLYLMDGDKSSSSAAEGGRIESDQRILLLNKSLKRYQDIHVDVEEVTRDMEMMNTPKYARKALSGKLNITITCIRDVDHIASAKFPKRPESVVSIKVDDVEQAKTKASRSGKWNEDFSIDVDKANEIELSVYDKSSTNLVPVAVTWALLSDITEEIRKRKVANDVGNDGWVSATNISSAQAKSYGNFSYGATASPTASTQSNSPVNVNVDSPSTPSTASSNTQLTAWLSLEPVGQILITVSFDKSNKTGSKQFMGALGRHGAIRQKKEEVFEQHGHQFVQKQFYNIMCCALCGEFLRYTGYQCQDCRFLCHKKCYQKVVTKCISKSSTELDPDEAKLNHRIPHRFEPILNRGTKWCCHCGYILPWGRKNVRKCTECGVMCHANCTHLVPDFCGMSMEMANKILTTIKSTQPAKPTGSGRKIQQKTASSSPSKASSTTAVSKDVYGNMSDDEQDRFDAHLPTQTTHQYQEPIEAPYPKQTHRRPPPPSEDERVEVPLKTPEDQVFGHRTDQSGSQDHYDQHDYTFASTKSEEPAHLGSASLYAPLQGNGLPDFSKFDYDNGRSEQLIPSETIEEAVPTQEQVSAAREEAPVAPQTAQNRVSQASPHRRRRRRKIGLDDFQFLAVLGKGNFGKVMLAESRHTQKLCAIKVLKKDFIVENDEADSVKSEKRVFLTANKEMHPFLLNLHCCFQTENRIYFVMEYISGGDLMWHIQKLRFSARRAKFYACEVLLALKYFHDNGIVYRDLKLDNILLTVKGHIKIADYGLCKENMWHQKTTKTFCGTPEFMAPEIIAGKQYERSVDWWAFGVLLFQMLLCQSPFKGDDEDEVFNAIEHDEVKYPISMPRQTVLVLQALLTKDPLQRLGSGERDAEEIMEHSYFLDVNFDDVLHCRIQAPYLPEITSEHDYSNFDQEFTSETPRLTPVDTVLTLEMQEQFRGFSHISEDVAI